MTQRWRPLAGLFHRRPPLHTAVLLTVDYGLAMCNLGGSIRRVAMGERIEGNAYAVTGFDGSVLGGRVHNSEPRVVAWAALCAWSRLAIQPWEGE
jgi:hypothetical protein